MSGWRLRDVRLTDGEAYRRMRCDPVMMAELGGPLPVAGIEEKVRRDVAAVSADASWISMIVPAADPELVAGTVSLWSHDGLSEIGWMVLPEHQGRGVGKAAVRQLLDRARLDGRWGVVHAYPALTNGPSNGICASLGFALHEPRDFAYNGAVLICNDWSVDLS